MSSGIVIPREIGYPAGALVSVFYLTLWQMLKVERARGAARIKYPQLYAEKAEAEASEAVQIFNCTQRAHQNTLENMHYVIGGTVIIALNHPIGAAGLCGIWAFSRVLYTIGYCTGDPARRNAYGGAALSTLSMIGFLLGSTWSVAKLLL